MTGTIRKMTASRTVVTASERYDRTWCLGRSSGLVAGKQAVAESGVIMDVLELRIDLAELLADALDEGADIGAIAFIAIAGDEVLAVNEIVDFAIGNVLAGTQGQQGDDLELGQRQIDRCSGPTRAVDVEAKLEMAD